MLYVLIEAQRAWLEKAHKDNELPKGETRTISEDNRGSETISSLCESKIPDSEWFTLSPKERLAWAKASRDPRIAEGQLSPLEKRILSCGGVHATAARNLVTQTRQEERTALCGEQARSLDYWLARAESYYNKRMVDMMKREGAGVKAKKKVEEATSPNIDGQEKYYCVSEREKKQIKRHIRRASQAREFKTKTWRQPRFSETLPKIILPEKPSIPKEQRRRQVNERELLQIKDHQERMIRGRELLEQRLKERILRKSQSQIPQPEKRSRGKKEGKEFERVVAYPLFQPSNTSRIKVDILMEKYPDEEKVSRIIKPYGRKFLAVPPFLRTQIGKLKDQ